LPGREGEKPARSAADARRLGDSGFPAPRINGYAGAAGSKPLPQSPAADPRKLRSRLSTGYTGRMEFEWDPGKAAENLRKHKVSFAEAATVLGDFLGTTASDPDHSDDEHRYITAGLSNRGRLLMVAHAERHARIRIISARELTRNERRVYEETQG